MSPESLLDEVADAILDGTPIDWNAVDSRVAPMEKALIEPLKTLAAWRHVARTGDVPEPPGTWSWGHLRVFERIGHGAYGNVYRAWDSRLDREVALKLLPADAPSVGHSASTIIEEGRLLARVHHPNVVTIYGAERRDGHIGLWMEFIKGCTLEEALRDGRTFTAADVTRLGVQLCHAVSAVHAAGLLHRDIKAQNVMLDDSGRLVLMDFGTGREIDDSTDMQIAGTPLYLAPEVLSGRAATSRSDVYSIGVVLFRGLTNTYPVSGSDLADLRRAHAAGGDASARVDRAEIPQRLRQVLARAIDPDPARRFESPDDMGTALAAVERAPARRRVVIAAAAAAAIVGAGAVGWSLGLRELIMPVTPVTIAVLPFTNVGSDPGNEDFIDGLTSDLISKLAVINGLQPRSQTSSRFFKDRPRDLRDVAKQLHVELVVEATVQRVGNQLRIDARLVRAPEDVPVWSQSFDGTIDHVFAMQDQISHAIANTLRLTLRPGQRPYQTTAAAIDLYLRGRALVAQRGTERGEQAAKIFERVIAMDAAFAPAHAGLAEAYAAMSWQLTGLSFEEGIAAMRPAALKALELDPFLAEAHGAMGLVYTRDQEWEKARESFERAIELNPTLTDIRSNYAISTLLVLGEARKAESLLADAMIIDPLSLPLRRDLAWTQFVGGRYEDAVMNVQQVLAADPTLKEANLLLARALIQAGRPADAIALFEGGSELKTSERWLTSAYVMMGRRKDVDRLIEEQRNERPYRQALIYAALGDKDRTFEALNRAVDDAPQRTAFVIACPEMALLRGDPRLSDLKKRLNLR